VNVSCPECRSVFRVDPAKLPSTTVRARCSVCGGVITVTAGSSIEDEFSSSSSQMTKPARSLETADAMIAQRATAGLGAALLDTGASTERVPHAATPVGSGPKILPDAARAPTIESSPVPKTQAPVAPPTGRPVLFPPRPMMPGNASAGGSAARPIVAPRPAVAPPSAPAATSPSAPAATSPPAPRPNSSQAISAAPNSAPTAQPLAATPRPAAPTSSAGAPATRTPINPFLANDPHAKAKRLARALVSDLVTYFPQKRQDGLRDGTLKQLFKDEIQKSYEEYVLQVGREFAETTPHFQEALNDILAGGQKVF
jgi:predicted Zn finger-like uncharacterized protein